MKITVKAALVIVLLLAAALAGVYFSLNRIIITGVQQAGSRLTGTEVTLQHSSVSLFSGTGLLRGLSIGNPDGYNSDAAFTCGKVSISLDLPSLLSDSIVINTILVSGPEITWEVRGTRSNIQTIADTISSRTSPDRRDSPEQSPQKPPGDPSRSVIIKRFMIREAKINLAAAALRGRTLSVDLPDITLRDIGEGITLEESFELIAETVSKNTVRAATGSVGTLIDDTRDTIRKLKGFFGK